MKNRFSRVDIVAIINELQSFIGMRVYQIYDVDTKTYLIKLNRYEEKVTLLLESGIRIHTTDYEWPKSPMPSGFAMKLRKHIKNKRLERVTQLGVDRILDLQFGINEAAYHVILELYDRGNLVLADYQYLILNILRPRTDNTNEDVRFAVRERYPTEKAVQEEDEQLTVERIENILLAARPGDNVRKILLSATTYGPALIDHILLSCKLSKNSSIGKGFDIAADMKGLLEGLRTARKIIEELSKGTCSGYVIQKEENNPLDKEKKILTNLEFHPFLFEQHKSMCHMEYPSFNKAVDAYFSGMEAQKIESKTHQKEKEAMKKLENVKKDHEKRLNKLFEEQAQDVLKAELIESNLELVEKAITIIRSAVANQISWSEISDLLQEAQLEGDPIAKVIKKLKLDINHFTILLSNPFDDENSKPVLVDIDLDLSAYGNARKYYNQKRHHAKKEQKTLEASEKAFKNAEKKTKQTLKEVAVISMITKARKAMWFEKFNWFISSENYLVIAGRDIPQNEVIVKRYMKPGDIYVHADIHGASSVVIKNHSKKEVPPKTLNEAGTMAVCYSTAWDAKVLSSAWWVHSDQVSKTAPTGEYLTTGSFMIRGKKNYLLPSQLVLGFGFLFKLDEDSIGRHINDRKVRENDVDAVSVIEEEENILLEEDEFSDEDHGDVRQSSKVEDVPNQTELVDEVNESEPEEESAYPDTEVKLPVLKRNLSIEDTDTDNYNKVINTDGTTLIISTNKRKSSNPTNSVKKDEDSNSITSSRSSEKQGQMKRGQKSKLKKIKEKYKDQDEEERELKMKILASAGGPKADKKKKKKDKGNKVTASAKPVKDHPPIPKTVVHLVSTEDEDVVKHAPVQEEHSDDEDATEDPEESATTSDDFNILNTLTGQPLPEDTLLYAVPVCAPYNSIQNYKYKVKAIPGTGRRGKAAKTALNIFLHDKNATQREKDCLRSVKDQDISRNFPGKVKLSHSYVKKK